MLESFFSTYFLNYLNSPVGTGFVNFKILSRAGNYFTFKLCANVFRVLEIWTVIKLPRILVWHVLREGHFLPFVSFEWVVVLVGPWPCARWATVLFIFKVWVQWKVAFMLVLCYPSHQSNSHLPRSGVSSKFDPLSLWNKCLHWVELIIAAQGTAATAWILWLPARWDGYVVYDHVIFLSLP